MKLNLGKKVFLIIILLLNICFVKGSSYDTISILKNIDLQIESTSSINKMYNYNFKDSEKEFKWLEKFREQNKSHCSNNGW